MASIPVLLLLLGGTFLLSGTPAQRIRARHHNMKVRINATGDTIVMKFVRPSPDVKLEGYILGYGSSVFSKQLIPLPENGKPYETEMDAEPKYLVAVQPIPANDVKKHCTGKVNLEKPLHLVIGSISPTSVLLSWGNHLKTPYEGNVMNECLEEGYYTIRFRERNRKWIYQTCPTSDTVIDNLKPNTPYEFGVRSNKDNRSGMWSKPVVHNTNTGNKNGQQPYKQRHPPPKLMKPLKNIPVRPALHNNTRPHPPSLIKYPGFSGLPRSSFESVPESQQETIPLPSSEPKLLLELPEKGNGLRTNRTRPADRPTPALSILLPTTTTPTTTSSTLRTISPITKLPSNGGSLHGQTTKAPPTRAPEKRPSPAVMLRSQDGSLLLRSVLANEQIKANTWGRGSNRNVNPSLPFRPYSPAASSESGSLRPALRNPLYPFSNGYRPSSSRSSSSSPTVEILGANGQPHRGIAQAKPVLWSRTRLGAVPRPAVHAKPNFVRKLGETDKVNLVEKSEKSDFLPQKVPPATAKPTKLERTKTTTVPPTAAATKQETWEESDLFKSQPASDIDALGNKRYVAPHVVYQTGKKPDEPCSITSSLTYFPESEPGETNVTSRPKNPPSNLTVVTVEGCPSFIILDWEKTDNHTTEYEVISTAKGPDGEQVSVLTTNQTHTAVENLKPESSYEFKVKPKNELGEGPPSEPVSFSTESADPRVSENVSGKDAIWTQFPFKTDSYSDCHGKQYVKRTWYRKFVGVQLCNSLRYKIYLSDSLTGKFYNIGDQSGFGEDHCQFVDSFLDGRTGRQLRSYQLPSRTGFYRALRQEPVHFGQMGGHSHINYVSWYECGIPIPGKW
ncbi:ABI family, member 3 (NESH) binding protein b isoform X1 [Nothobranchius furzeri]|uniref:ABI family, member 3 (NESH) binding protein n=2 Tax=Nothobranchius furzeri TaxID=105023 RepID=A0A1A8AYI8_NOTFU|nr:ABI family, member 3 (NESH) binding protein b isoform X1 [Nothobranchius furzeri]KAF7207120.1 transcript variant X1 [Nothobranchius furzeri]